MSTVTVPETGLFASLNGKLRLLRLQFDCCANTFRPQKVMPSKIKRQTHMMNSNNNSASNRLAAAKQGAEVKNPNSHVVTPRSRGRKLRVRDLKLAVLCMSMVRRTPLKVRHSWKQPPSRLGKLHSLCIKETMFKYCLYHNSSNCLYHNSKYELYHNSVDKNATYRHNNRGEAGTGGQSINQSLLLRIREIHI